MFPGEGDHFNRLFLILWDPRTKIGKIPPHPHLQHLLPQTREFSVAESFPALVLRIFSCWEISLENKTSLHLGISVAFSWTIAFR